MPVYTYLVIEEHLEHPELGNYVSYGIKAMCGDSEVGYVSDVSVNKEFVEDVVRRCNEGNLDVIHLMDVVEDSLP